MLKPPSEVLKSSLYFEDCDHGLEYFTETHTITNSDLQIFSDLTHDHHPLHRDDAFAQSMGFSKRIAHGLFSLALMEGLKSKLKIYETTSVASLGWDAVRFKKPILSGETVQARVFIDSKRMSKQPGKGVVIETVDLINQKGEVALTGQHATLVICRQRS